MPTIIVICNDHYPVADIAHFRLVKLYSKLYYVIFQNILVSKFISSKATKEKLQVLFIHKLEQHLI